MSMNFFARLSNLWTGFMSLWLTDVEKRHPEIAYQNAIDSMIGKHEKLKMATAAIIRRRNDIEAKLSKETASLKSTTMELETALATNQDDLAVVLIQKKNALDESVTNLRAEYDLANKDAEDAKSSLLQVKAEIDKLKAEKDRMLAQMQSAQARIKIEAQLDGLSVDAEVRALDNVREHIKNTVAQANLGKELRDSDLDTRLAKLRQSAGSVTARQQLEEMKKARATQTAGQGTGNKNM